MRNFISLLWELHSFTNLEDLLSGIVLSKDLAKDNKRATIAISYCTMACLQVATISSLLGFSKFFNPENFILGFSLIFLTVEKYIYHSVNEKLFKKISNFFFFWGIAVLMKT